jgi:DNA replication protein DnaC
MLTHPTLEKLRAMKLTGMTKELEEQLANPEIESLTFLERLALLVDREDTERADRRLRTRLKQAKLRVSASPEDIDYKARRSLDKSVMQSLSNLRWIKEHQNIIITGPTGVGKTYLACALAQQACRENYRAQYHRLPRLLHHLEIGKGDGSYRKTLAKLDRMDCVVLDDWGLAPLTSEQRRDLLELLDDRYARRSTIITSQLPVDQWHTYLDDPTLADAILDRVTHNAHHLALTGDSMRKQKHNLTSNTNTSTR